MSDYESTSSDSGRTSEQGSASTDKPANDENGEARGAEHASASEGTHRDQSSGTSTSHQAENGTNVAAHRADEASDPSSSDRGQSAREMSSDQHANDANAEARGTYTPPEYSARGTSVRGETVGAQQDNLAPNSHSTGGHRSGVPDPGNVAHGGSAQRGKSIDPERSS